MYGIFAAYTKFYFQDDFSAVWRRGHESVSNTKKINKEIAYIQNDLNQWKYLASLFPNTFDYTEEKGRDYEDYCTFKIAYKYKDYRLAKKVIKKNTSLKKYTQSLSHKTRVLSVSNFLVFNVYCITKDLLKFLRFR